jgi:hypothetical protein
LRLALDLRDERHRSDCHERKYSPKDRERLLSGAGQAGCAEIETDPDQVVLFRLKVLLEP